MVNGQRAKVVDLMYSVRTFADHAVPPPSSDADSLSERGKEAKQQKQQQKDAEDEAKAARLKAMQDKMAAWQAQQQKQ